MEAEEEVSTRMAVERKPVYLYLPLKVDALAEIAQRKLTSTINKTFYAAGFRILLKSCPVMSIWLKIKVLDSAASLYLSIRMFLWDNVRRPYDQALV